MQHNEQLKFMPTETRYSVNQTKSKVVLARLLVNRVQQIHVWSTLP